MGVLEPLVEAIDGNVPATPPDLQDLQTGDSSDDLFEETETSKSQKKENNVFDFDKHILPLMPSKMEFEGLLGLGLQNNNPNSWDIQTLQQQQKKKKKNLCSRCFEEIKRDLKKLAMVVENFRNERDTARTENDSLKNEVKELKRILKEKEDKEKSDVRMIIDNKNKEIIDVNVKRERFQNVNDLLNNQANEKESIDYTKHIGISSVSITLQGSEVSPALTYLQSDVQPKSKKTIAELRREFFAQEFENMQKSFTARSFLEIKPEEKKETERSRLTIDVKPKQKIGEIVSKISSKFGSSKLIPEAAPITLFQRFEKTKHFWKYRFEESCA